MRDERLNKSFDYHVPKADQAERLTVLRRRAKEFATLIADIVPESREKSLAMTNLEQAVMWANKGIVVNDDTEGQ